MQLRNSCDKCMVALNLTCCNEEFCWPVAPTSSDPKLELYPDRQNLTRANRWHKSLSTQAANLTNLKSFDLVQDYYKANNIC